MSQGDYPPVDKVDFITQYPSVALRINDTLWRARRVPLVDGDKMPELQAGDYCGPTSAYTGGVPAIHFVLPIGRDADVHGYLRAIHHVCAPPHTFRECGDGSIEVRASIGIEGWHCWLDEGNVWRHP